MRVRVERSEAGRQGRRSRRWAGLLVVGGLLSATPAEAGAEAETGEAYVPAYNTLVRMLADRCAVVADELRYAGIHTNEVLALKDLTSSNPNARSVNQWELNRLRQLVYRLAGGYFALPPEAVKTDQPDPLVAFYLTQRSELLAGIGNGNFFTKVPGEYTADGQTQYDLSGGFEDVPLLWVHFQELYDAIQRLRYTGRQPAWTNSDGGQPQRNIKDSGMSDASTWAAATDLADTWYSAESHTIVAPPGAGSWGMNPMALWYRAEKWRNYAFAVLTGVPATVPHSVRFYDFAIASPGIYGTGWPWACEFSSCGEGCAVKDRWTVWHTTSASTESSIYSRSLGEGAEPEWPAPPVPYQNTGRGFQISGVFAILEWNFPTPKLVPPCLDDPDDDGLAAFACECNTCAAAVKAGWRRDFGDAQGLLPLGISSGLTTGGLRVKAYVTEHFVEDQLRQMFSLDTRIAASAADPGGQWSFVTVRRPSGQEVVFSLCGREPGKPVGRSNLYRLRTDGGFTELHFAGEQVVHRFGAGGHVSQVRMVKDGQELSMDGWDNHWPGMVTYCDGAKILRNVCDAVTAVPVYDGDLIARVDYQDAYEQLQGSIAGRKGSRIYEERDATGALIRQTHIVHTAGGVEIWRGVRTDDGLSVALKEVRTQAEEASGRRYTVTESIILNPGRPDAQSNVTVRLIERFPWGEAPIEETVGAGTPTSQTTFYTYEQASGSNAYGRLTLEQRPDGTWTRYDGYDSLGRPTAVVEPFGDAPPTAPAADGRVRRYAYAGDSALAALGFPANEMALPLDFRPRLIAESVRGVEVSRTYHAYPPDGHVVKRCAAAGARYDDGSNLVTVTSDCTEENLRGRPRRIEHEDGTLSLFSYAFPAADRIEITRATGAGQGDAVTNGTTTVSLQDSSGRLYSELQRDVASGIVFAHRVYTRDFWGRATCVSNVLDGAFETTVYGCCGPETVVDADGIRTVSAYDELGRVLTTERLGVTTALTYDSFGHVAATRRSAAGEADALTSERYDGAGRLVESVDALGGRTGYAYGTNAVGGEGVTTTLPDGGTQVEDRARDGRVRSIGGTAEAPRAFAYGADADGVFSVEFHGADTNAAEWVKTWEDPLGRTARVLAADSAETRYGYDARGRLVAQSDGLVTRLTAYDERGEPFRSAVDMDGNGRIDLAGTDRITETRTAYRSVGGAAVAETESRVYPEAGSAAAQVAQLTRASADGARVWSIAFGRTNRIEVARERATATRVETATAPEGTQTVRTYRSGQLVAEQRRAAGGGLVAEVSFEYDGFGRPRRTSETAASGEPRETICAYNAADWVTGVTVRAGALVQSTSYAFDALGRCTRVRLPDGGEVCATFDLRGNLLSQSGARTYPLAYGYDPQGRLTSLATYRAGTNGAADVTGWEYDDRRGWLSAKRYADGSKVRYAYRPDGALSRRTWARGVATQFAYDAGGALTNVVCSDGTPAVTYALDRLGRPVRVVDGSGTNEVSYTADGQVEAERFASGVALTLEYDRLGRRTNLWVSGAGVARRTAYAYDDAGRIASVGDGRSTARYAYGPDGSTVAGVAVDSGAAPVLGTVRFYDGLDRLLSVSNAVGGATFAAAYAYNAANRRTAMTLADGSRWDYGYDELGQVTEARKRFADGVAAGGAQFEYAYDTIGNRRRARNFRGPGAPAEAYEADALNRYTAVATPGEVLVSGEADAGARVSVGAEGAAGRPANRHGEYYWRSVAVDNAAGPVTTNVVVRAVLAAGTNSLVRTERRLARVPPADRRLSYDADGNLLGDGLWNCAWDAENRLISVTPTLTNSLTPKLSFAYDSLGRRVAKEVAQVVSGRWSVVRSQAFAYDGWDVLIESAIWHLPSEIRTNVSSFVWGLDLSSSLQGAGGIGGLLSVVCSPSSVVGFPLYDGNGNVVALAGTNGATLARYEYGPFGEPLRASGPEAANNPWRFSTRYYDQETELVMYPMRPYSPALGRWLGRDPLGEDGGANLAAFVANNPADFVDPRGLALYVFDGTWNDRAKMKRPTNVAKLVDLYQGLKWYEKGVGTDWYTKPGGGAFGAGGQNRIGSMLEKLVEFYNTPDETGENQQIDVIGFSRGAAQARAFVNRINAQGGVPLLGPDGKPTGVVCPVKIRFLGIFDTVASFGWPGNNVNLGYDLSIPANVEQVRHAVALDEKRHMFPLSSALPGPNSPLTDLRIIQLGFPGAHSDIGGGYDNGDRSNYALMWMHDEAVDAGVPFLPLKVEDIGARNPIIHDERGWLAKWLDRPRNIYNLKYGR